MEKILELDRSYLSAFVSDTEIKSLQKEITAARKTLEQKTGAGNDFLGWLDLPVNQDKEEIARIQLVAKKIRKMAKILVVIGIGGSYLGTRAALDMLKPYFENRKRLEIIFAGQNLSSEYISDLLIYLKDRNFAVNVISKSGTTTETAIAFRALKELLETKYGIDGAKERIVVTTDKEKGALRKMASKEGYESFVVPSNIGGRYSVLTPVGLFPLACAGIKIAEIMKGAKAAKKEYKKADVFANDVHLYVAIRNWLYRSGKSVEMLVSYEPKLASLAEWWKQLFGESEGKNGEGLFVASANFTTDLHSLGQYIQEGRKLLFETVLLVEEPNMDHVIKEDKENLDQLNYLAGKTVDYVNKKAAEGTLMAHSSGEVPCLVARIKNLSSFTFGYLVYFFELSCAISGYVLGVNPFNQPGVEAYKKNMFSLLGKPGNIK